MAERCVKGDYIGFTFGGVHSSELGLMRVSNGSRYEQDLLPPLQDKTAQVNGRDGAVYFGSQYNTKPIKVPVAFDNMTEESFNQLKKLLQDKKPKYLWFDETPYKQWLVKAANVQNFKWVCFDESQNIARQNDGDPVSTKKRIYKGEGTLEFSCFSPYAESRVTFLDDEIDNIWGWNEEKTPRRLIEIKEPYCQIIRTNNQKTTKQKLELVTGSGSSSYVIYNKEKLSFSAFRKKIWEEQQSQDGNNRATGILALQLNFLQNGPNFIVYFPGDVLSGYDNSTRCYCIKDSSLLPLTVDTTHFFPAYNFSKNEQMTKIAVTKVSTQNDGESYYSIDLTDNNATQYLQTILFYQDENDNLFWIDPTSGEVNYEYPVFCSFIKNTATLLDFYNIQEWVESSGLRKQFSNQTYFNIYKDQCVDIYNAGDQPSNLLMHFSGSLDEEMSLTIYSSQDENWDNEKGHITIKPFSLIGDDDGFVIDSKLKMIKGVKNGVPTGNIYNKFHKEGDYFKIPVCEEQEYYTIYSTIDKEFSVEYKHYYI